MWIYQLEVHYCTVEQVSHFWQEKARKGDEDNRLPDLQMSENNKYIKRGLRLRFMYFICISVSLAVCCLCSYTYRLSQDVPTPTLLPYTFNDVIIKKRIQFSLYSLFTTSFNARRNVLYTYVDTSHKKSKYLLTS